MLIPYAECPAEQVETAFFHIYRDRLADVPIHNTALSVEAVDFQLWQGHWLGVLVTPWSMSVLMLPTSAEGWEMPGANQRLFRTFPIGPLAFLGNDEEELGQFLSCALFGSMAHFTTQADAIQAARAALLELFKDPKAAPPPEPVKPKLTDPAPISRRQLFGLRGKTE